MVLAVSAPLASAASTVPMSRPKLGVRYGVHFRCHGGRTEHCMRGGSRHSPYSGTGTLVSARSLSTLARTARRLTAETGLWPPVRLLEHRLDEVATGPVLRRPRSALL